ncbi:hypothetical protein [Aeromonas veronii]|uniref:hypothetical protein n=1 Tax=Aeromonas veronii TaxID=654 RepID=UPI00187DFE81|nr:hypothetical protein [Aeromonas veronii]MBE8734511.1 hypothetical protein [Aeromonas veronii]MBE8737946.1 hypothetical protein [Aeromonas veronii]MBE8743111.1 hypothetical protein [Aeromonas veronii]MBE8762415.1 hypothetical protein [Aeromonas veronii]MBE8838657.1 hypothetical protein [Aeromonas veronii]
MSKLQINTQMLTNADLDKFVDIIAAKVEAKIMANQQRRDIQSQITKALTDALAKQNKSAESKSSADEDIFANYKIEG